jgi:hypothetical protein
LLPQQTLRIDHLLSILHGERGLDIQVLYQHKSLGYVILSVHQPFGRPGGEILQRPYLPRRQSPYFQYLG